MRSSVSRGIRSVGDSAQCHREGTANHLVGCEFTVGDVRMRGIKLCEPCGYLQRTLGIDHLVQALAHRAGLNAEILTHGEIRVGDPVEATATP